MPRKAKEKVIENEIIDVKVTKVKSSTGTRKKAVKSDKKIEVKEKVEESIEKKSTASTKKKSATTTKKATTTSKKTPTAKTTSTSKKKTTKTKKTPVQIVEYYDLPYTYGNTMVKLLAQTPKTLFVYWEVSDLDIKNFKEQYGEDFFNITKPILIVRNLTLNKTTEIEINDFANCWYLSTEDSDCKFDIELARKFINNSNSNANNHSKNNYLPIAKSNNLQAPNDHIMFEKLSNFITFTDTSTGETIKKNIKSFNFLKDLYKFYKDMYNDELLKNPSSNFNF